MTLSELLKKPFSTATITVSQIHAYWNGHVWVAIGPDSYKKFSTEEELATYLKDNAK